MIIGIIMLLCLIFVPSILGCILTHESFDMDNKERAIRWNKEPEEYCWKEDSGFFFLIFCTSWLGLIMSYLSYIKSKHLLSVTIKKQNADKGKGL